MLLFLLLISIFLLFGTIQSVSETTGGSQYHCIDVNGTISSCAKPTNFTDHLVAYARYSNRINSTGWAELEIVTNANQTDLMQAYFAGYLEGHLTGHLIDSSRISNGFGVNGDASNAKCKSYTKFINENLAYVLHKINKTERRADEYSDDKIDYWQQISLTLAQLAGLDDGHAGQAKPVPHTNLNPCGTILLNMADELEDIDEFAEADDEKIQEAQPKKPKTENPNHITKCSAFIKWLPHQGEVLVAHNTWGHYSTMLRLLKKYTFNFGTSKAKSIAFSSYPGLIASDDDFYITSQELIIQETTIDTYNTSIYDGLEPHGMVLEFIRNVVANRLATTGHQWSTIFKKHNSGTYNNQFMIVDLAQLTPAAPGKQMLEPGFLTVLEQQPNMIHFEDMTGFLQTTSYWASYNIPFFWSIYKHSGFLQQYEKYGDPMSYHDSSRGRIFSREQESIQNLTSLYHLMRYNDFKKDPLSKCDTCTPPYSADYSIASRSDLNDPKGKYPRKDIAFNLMGAIDAKVTSIKLAKNLEFVAVSGPTDQQQPAFDWNAFPDKELLHRDQPKVWKFKPVVTKWSVGADFPAYMYNL